MAALHWQRANHLSWNTRFILQSAMVSAPQVTGRQTMLSRLLSPVLRTESGRAGPHDTITASALPLTDSILCTAHNTLR